MTTQAEPLSPFLAQQAEKMKAIAQQNVDIEERQKRTIVPAVQESERETQGKYEIVTHDATNDRTVTRIITPLPTPQRIQAQPVISKAELSDMIESLRSEMSEQQSRFDQKDSIDQERSTKRLELSSQIAELTRQLSAAQGELDSLNRLGSVRDGFIAFAKQAEGRITAIATGVYNFLLEKISQDKHEASYRELTPLLKEEVKFKVDRSGVRGLTQASFSRLHEAPKDQISNARVEATLEKVYTATETLEKVLK